MSLLLARIAEAHRTSAPTHATWNPSDKAAGLALSNSNKDMAWASGTTWVAGRATLSRNSGKCYFEMQCLNANDNCLISGVATSASFTNNYVGADVNGWGLNYNYSGGLRPVHSNSFTVLTAGGVCGTNDRMMCAVDFTAGKIWFGTKGTWSGSPASGTGEIYDFTAGTSLFPMGAAASGGSSRLITDPALFTYTPPSGFTGTW